MKPLPSISLLLLLVLIPACSEKKADEPLTYGAVAAASPEAARAGMEILRQGGNAADAAIAISFVLGVTEPAMSGIGGGTQVMMYIPSEEQPFSIDGSTLSPALTPTHYAKDSLNPYQRASIPSTVNMMGFLYSRYASGRFSWAELLQPAIGYAREGFLMGPFREKVYAQYLEDLQQGLPATAPWLKDTTSGKLIQPALASTLQKLATQGAAAFYQGEIAAMIARDMRENEGWIRKADLAQFPEPVVVPSIHFHYRGYEVFTQPEPCGGWIVQAMLQKLAELEARQPDRYLDHLVEAIHHGHAYRKNQALSSRAPSENGETTHFSVMDSQGMTLAVTASINAYYGARRAHPELGFLYNSYMNDFTYGDSTHKYAVGPGKKAYSSMSPTLVMQEGKIVMAIGSPGSSRIISTVAQLVDRYTAARNPEATLIALPRVHVYGRNLYLEDPQLLQQLSPDVAARFELKSPSPYLQQQQLNAYFGGVHMIVRMPEGMQAFADPRRDGLAVFE